jgi:putative FmdB family regulatory protein
VPIYDYACTKCGQVTEVIHGINDAGPTFCPNCGAKGTMKKALSAPAVVFKGSGWAKVDRRSSSGSTGAKASKAKAGDGAPVTGGEATSTSGEAKPGGSNAGSSASGSTSSGKPSSSTGGD